MSSSTAPSACARRSLSREVVALLLCVWAVAGCQKPPFSEAKRLGGALVSADVLNRGHAVYAARCLPCHGLYGSGDGPQAPPRTRALSAAVFKYKSTLDDALPTHDDLLRTIRAGVPTRMPAFADTLSAAEADAVAHFIKTLSPRWASESPPDPLPIPPNPFNAPAERAQAADRGRVLYHTQRCWQCHPAFAPAPLLRQWLLDAQTPPDTLDDLLRQRAALGPLDKQPPLHLGGAPMLPIDILNVNMRAGSTDADLFRTLAVGLPPHMPGLSPALPPADIWALSLFLRRLQSPSSLSYP